MLSERDIELAHPEAFDFVSATCPRPSGPSSTAISAVAATARRRRRVQRDRPDHQAPSPSRRAARRPRGPDGRRNGRRPGRAAGQRPIAGSTPRTRPSPGSTRSPSPAPAEPETQVQPRPQLPPPAEDETRVYPIPRPAPGRNVGPADGHSPACVAPSPRPARRCRCRCRCHHHCRHRRPTQPWRAQPNRSSQSSSRFTPPLRPRYSASGAPPGKQRPARPTKAGRSTLNVHGLKPLPGNDFYECWWVTPGHTRLLATGGSFVVGNSGSTTVTMTTGVDPTQQFRTMEITAETPSNDGALNGPVLLIS